MTVVCSGATDLGVLGGEGTGLAGDWNGNSHKIFYVDTENRDYIIIEGEGSTTKTGSGSSWVYTHTWANTFDNPSTTHAGSGGTNVEYSDQMTVNNVGARIQTNTISFSDDIAARITTYIGDSGDASGLTIPVDIDHDHNETPDDILASIRDDELSPAYRGTAYVAFDGLELKDFGNQMPQFNFEVDARPREPEITSATATTICTIGQCLDSMLIRAGRYKHLGVGGAYTVGDHFDTTEFQGVNSPTDEGISNLLRGYGIVGAKSVKSSISNLILRYDILVSESSGYLKFIRRGQEDVLVIPEKDLAAYAFPETNMVGTKFGMTDQPDTNLPNEINVDYFDINDSYQKGSQKAMKTISGLPRVDQLDLPLSMTATEAQECAVRVLYQTWSQRNHCTFSLPPKYININENDILSVTVNEENYKVRVLEIHRGADFLHKITGLITESSFAPYSGEGDDGTVDEGDPYFPPAMLTYALDSPAFHSLANTTAGHYIVGCTSKVDQEFRGAEIYASDTSGGPYAFVGSYPNEAMIVYVGEASGGFPIMEGPIGCWDETQTIKVKVLGPLSTSQPASAASDIEVYGGANQLYIGGELIGFRTVTALGSNLFRLSRLLRGRRGTQDFVDKHYYSEYGVIVTNQGSAGVVNINHESNSSIGYNQYYKMLPMGASFSDVSELPQLAEGRRVKPFPVGGIKGYNTNPYSTGSGGNTTPTGDWIVDFTRCDRAFFKMFSSALSPNTEDTEEYRCRVYDKTGTALLRTITKIPTANGSVIIPTVYDAMGLVVSLPKLTYAAGDYYGGGGDQQKSESQIIIELFKVGSIVSEGVFIRHTITQDFKY